MKGEDPPNESIEPPISSSSSTKHSAFFELLTRRGYIVVFLITLPILWAIFVGIGWSKEDKVEESVYQIWTRQRSPYNQDKEYAAKYDRDNLGATTFAALAVARDGGNLFTPARLENIRKRMQETEGTKIEYKGVTYTWDDVCASNNVGLGTSYKFPCARLSPMDFFLEARWFFEEEDRVTWYEEVARKLVIAPRIPRFGILQQKCSNLTIPENPRGECNDIIMHRMVTDEPMKLFSDIGNMENNNPCKRCIEEEYEDATEELHTNIGILFGVLAMELGKAGNGELAAKYESILSNLDRQAAIDFYNYNVIRNLYAELGAPDYMKNKDNLNMFLCTIMQCDPTSTTYEEAKQALLFHADHAFSSSVTSGNPLPSWGDNGEGYFMEGDSPVGGSGLNLTGIFGSMAIYFDLANYMQPNWDPLYENGKFASPNDAEWTRFVETDPIYKYFMAGETQMTGHCGNGDLKGTSGTPFDEDTKGLMANATQHWCTQYNEPYETSAPRTVQHFARMWYDLLVDSPNFLNLVQGSSDPYIWTTGQGCGYSLSYPRYSYSSNMTNQEELFGNVSGELYFIDEGESVGTIDHNLLMGGTEPYNYSTSKHLTKVSVVQTIYPALIPKDIVKRVENCNRPGGSAKIDIEDAEEILFRFKEKFEHNWAKDWNDETDDVQFVGFFDDSGVMGTTGRMLKEITLSNKVLVIVSIFIIAAFSVFFLFSCDVVESRILITSLGVGLVTLAFFAAVSFGLIVGIKINVTIAWTLPFIMLGLGVDDMYIILLALRKQRGYSLQDFVAAMQEVIVPVTMTSVVNACMFAIMNINDIPAVYLTAQVALISVIFLYLTIVFCFPAWCFLDMKRQANGRYDVFVWKKKEDLPENREKGKLWASFFYERIYKPLLLDSSPIIVVMSHFVVWLAAAALFGIGIWGLTAERQVGLGLEDFFPETNQASRWAELRTEELASWSIQMNWGAIDYSEPDNQMRVIKQFEGVVSTANVAEVDTKRLWLADFALWTTHQCTENFDRDFPERLECGHNQIYDFDNSTCIGKWIPNKYGLRMKEFADLDTCVPFEGGICRPTAEMHPADLQVDLGGDTGDWAEWCPVFEGWSDDKLQFCLGKWREFTGGSGRLVLQEDRGTPAECDGDYFKDENVTVPIPYSSGPTMFTFDLFSHEITIDMIEETRAICDDDSVIHCWLSGIPYDYWSQYISIYNTFFEIAGISVAVGFGVSFIFLFLKLWFEQHHSTRKIIVGSLVGALLIAVTTILSLVAVSGLSALFDVSFTGFSIMSFVLSVGFSVEYSVHVVARWLRASPDLKSSLERVEYTMSFLMLPTFMSFVSSTIGVACLAFTEFEFNEVFFFRPLMIVMFVTYFYGCWWLPVCLTLLDFDQVKLGFDKQESVDILVKEKVGGKHDDDEEEEVEIHA